MADEEKIRKLEGAIEVNSKKMEIKIQELQDALEAERRKVWSMNKEHNNFKDNYLYSL